MAKTLLNAVNETLKKTNIIAGESNLFTSLTDSAQQTFIDVAVQMVNEGIDELYTVMGVPKPKEQAEDQIVLATDVRSYDLPDDLVQLHFPLIDKTNNQYIHKFPGGYNHLLILDPEQDDTGLPLWGAISPVDGTLHLDRAPTATENGNVYTFQYHKDLELTAATDKVPFGNAVFRAMVPAWAELWKRAKRNTFDAELFNASIGRAARLVSQEEARDNWSPR